MENDLIVDLIFGGESEMDCRGPVEFNKAVEEDQDPIGSFLKTQELDHLAKNLPKLPIHVHIPSVDEILGDSDITTDADVLVKHVEVESEEMTLRKSAELSDEEVAEIKEYELRKSLWS